MDEDVAESNHAAERPCKLGLHDASLLEHAKRGGGGVGDRQPAVGDDMVRDVHAGFDRQVERSLDDSLRLPVARIRR